MADCPNCGRRLDDGECTRCGFKDDGVVETTEQSTPLENTAQPRPARKTTRKKG